jgi:hypothetical protein
MVMRAIATVFAVAVLAGGCQAGNDPAVPSSTPVHITTGVQGTALVDEGCPVLPVGSQCPQRPLRARVIVLDSKGTEIARADTSDTGKFVVSLSAGHYVLQGQNLTDAPLPSATPVPITVRDGALTSVTINFDSGVRGPASR